MLKKILALVTIILVIVLPIAAIISGFIWGISVTNKILMIYIVLVIVLFFGLGINKK